MKKVIRRWGSKLVFSERGIALCRGISGRQCKFLPWNEVAAVGYFVGELTHVAYDADCVSLYPHVQLRARPYSDYDIFVYFSLFAPKGFGYDDILPLLRDGRNIFFNLGGGGYFSHENIKKIAQKTEQIIRVFYNGKIINRSAAYHD